MPPGVVFAERLIQEVVIPKTALLKLESQLISKFVLGRAVWVEVVQLEGGQLSYLWLTRR